MILIMLSLPLMRVSLNTLRYYLSMHVSLSYLVLFVLLGTLWNVDSVMNSAMEERIFNVSLIRDIMDVLLNCNPRVSVLSKAISLVSHWLSTHDPSYDWGAM
eukprot:520564_1